MAKPMLMMPILKAVVMADFLIDVVLSNFKVITLYCAADYMGIDTVLILLARGACISVLFPTNCLVRFEVSRL